MDYLDIVPQLEFISSLFTNGNDINPAAWTGRVTRMAQPDVHLLSGFSFQK